MNEPRESPKRNDEPALYEIRLTGHLDDRWADRFDGLTLSREDNGVTLLSGPVTDQTALHGILRAIGNLGVRLLSVTPVQLEAADGRPRVASHHVLEEPQPWRL